MDARSWTAADSVASSSDPRKLLLSWPLRLGYAAVSKRPLSGIVQPSTPNSAGAGRDLSRAAQMLEGAARALGIAGKADLASDYRAAAEAVAVAADRLGGDTSSSFFGLGAQEFTDLWRDAFNRATGSDTTY